MDLFTSVAERMKESSPVIRPLILSPFETIRPGVGFEVESLEIEARAPNEAVVRHVPPDATRPPNTSEPEESPSTVERTSRPPEKEAQPAPLKPRVARSIENIPLVESQRLDPQEPSKPAPAELVIPDAPAPIERLVYVHEGPGSVVAATNDGDHESPDEPTVPPARTPPTIQNEFVTQLSSITVENQNLWSRQFEIDASTSITYAPLTVNNEAPSIVVPSNPIEVAIYPTATNSQIIHETSPQTSNGARMEADRPEQATVVDIRIGRIEVHSAKDIPSGRRITGPRPPNTRLSLDDLLKKRGRS